MTLDQARGIVSNWQPPPSSEVQEAAREILDGAIPGPTSDDYAKARAAFFGPTGVILAADPWMWPKEFPYAAPVMYDNPNPDSTNAGIFTNPLYVVQLNHYGYVSAINGDNVALYGRLCRVYASQRYSFNNGTSLDLPLPAPVYEAPVSFADYQSWFQGNGQSGQPCPVTYTPGKIISSFDYRAAIVAKQAAMSQAPGHITAVNPVTNTAS